METKPALYSVTLWVNALMPLLYLFVPAIKETLSVEAVLGIVALVNAVIRVLKTDKAIGSVV